MTTTSNTTTRTASGTATPSAAASVRPVLAPAVAIYEDPDGYTLEAEMPGVSKDGVQITVEHGELVLGGTRSAGSLGACLHAETGRPDYRRVFDLDPAVDTSQITARLDQGLLTLRLPKAPDQKPRRICVGD